MNSPRPRTAAILGALLILGSCGLKGPLQPLPEGAPGLGESLLPWETTPDTPEEKKTDADAKTKR